VQSFLDSDNYIIDFLKQVYSLDESILSNEKIISILKDQYWCNSRDIFGAKLAGFDNLHKNPLLTAICGEIGNNAYDHNLGKWNDVPGLYFNQDFLHTVVLLDRGQGVYNSLKKVRPQIKDDSEALGLAFVEHVSGREPEHRGNGLKFVADIIRQNKWKLFFQSGKGVIQIKDGQIGVRITTDNEHCTKGCLAVIKYE
jgi:hypothetical protein